MTITLKAMNEHEMNFFERGLKALGYTKTNDSMWAEIYENENENYQYVLIRNF